MCIFLCVCFVFPCMCSCLCLYFVKNHSLVCNGWHRSAFRQTGRQAGGRSLVVNRTRALHPLSPLPPPVSVWVNPGVQVNEKGLDHREQRQSSPRHLCSPPAHWDPSPWQAPLSTSLSPRRLSFPRVTHTDTHTHRLATRWPPNTTYPAWH